MSFSRMQLAAALLEYDNDNPHSTLAPRQASQSAIFAHTRRSKNVGRNPNSSYGDQDVNGRSRQSSSQGGSTIGYGTRTVTKRKSFLSMEFGNENGDQNGEGDSRDRIPTSESQTTSYGAPTRGTSMYSALNASTSGRLTGQGKGEEIDTYSPRTHGQVDLASWGLPSTLTNDSLDNKDNRDGSVSNRVIKSSSVSAKSPETIAFQSRHSVYADNHLSMSQSADPSLPISRLTLSLQHEPLGPLSSDLETAIDSLPKTNPHIDLSARPSIVRQTQTTSPRTKKNGGRTVSFGSYEAITFASIGMSDEIPGLNDWMDGGNVRERAKTSGAGMGQSQTRGVGKTGRPSIMDRGRPNSSGSMYEREPIAGEQGEEILRSRDTEDTEEVLHEDPIGSRPSSRASILDRGRPKSAFEIDEEMAKSRRSRVASFDTKTVIDAAASSASIHDERNSGRTSSIMDRARPRSLAQNENDRIRRVTDSTIGSAPLRSRDSMFRYATGVPLPESPNRQSSFSISFPASVPLPDSPGPNDILGHGREEFLEAPTSPTFDMSNPSALPTLEGQRVSRFDPKAARQARRMSGNSEMTEVRGLLRDGAMGGRRESGYQRETYSRAPQRPKMIVLPTPLQGKLDASMSAPPKRNTVEARGFQFSKQKPMPFGSLTRPDSFVGSLPSSSLSDMSLAKKLFSSQLEVGGVRGDEFIGGAEEDGQIGLHNLGGWDADEDDYGGPSGYGVEAERERGGMQGPDDWKPLRMMEGPSMIDKIEMKKQAQKTKMRAFAGDSRPSMMARDQSQSTLNTLPNNPISPSGTSPVSLRPSQTNDRLSRPLLAFESDANLPTSASAPAGRRLGDRSKSVFGVDTIWNREVERMKLVEEAERQAANTSVGLEKKDKKNKRKSKKAQVVPLVEPDNDVQSWTGNASYDPPMNMTSDLGLSSPYHIEEPEQRMLDQQHQQQQQEQPEDPALSPRVRHPTVEIDDWCASSDEERNRRKGKTNKRKSRAVKRATQSYDSSSEEDVPLSRAFGLKKPVYNEQAASPLYEPNEVSSEEDDVPLSKIKAETNPASDRRRTQTASTLASSRRLRTITDSTMQDSYSPATPQHEVNPVSTLEDEDDDDVPLASKHPHRVTQAYATYADDGEEEDDDVPLAARHMGAAQIQQQRLSMAMAAQQQQQQQEAFYRQSMFAGSQAMMSGMMMPGMMPPPMPMHIGGMGMGMGMMQVPYGMPDFNGSFVNMNGNLEQAGMGAGIDKWRREVEEKAGKGSEIDTVSIKG